MGPTASGCTSRTSTPISGGACADHPDVPTGSTNKYQCWEVVDPEKWVPDGYVCIRVDSRGAGRSPGVIDIWSLREAQDLAQCVDWAGVQPWSNGKVGLNGISYYAENQWQTAALQPKHLAAICTWEGPPISTATWRTTAVSSAGASCRTGRKHRSTPSRTGAALAGSRADERRLGVGTGDLSEELLGQNRRDFYEDCISRKLDTDPYWQSRMPDWNKVKTPLLSSANWGGQGLHPRGNFEGFVRSASGAEMARVPRHRALDAFLHELWPATAEEVLRPLPQRRGHRLEQAASVRRCAIPARDLSSGTRASGRSRAPSGPSSSASRRHDHVVSAAENGKLRHLCRIGRWRD